jgi:hypothetical protein
MLTNISSILGAYFESADATFFPRVDTFSFAQEPHVVYCF